MTSRQTPDRIAPDRLDETRLRIIHSIRNLFRGPTCVPDPSTVLLLRKHGGRTHSFHGGESLIMRPENIRNRTKITLPLHREIETRRLQQMVTDKYLLCSDPGYEAFHSAPCPLPRPRDPPPPLDGRLTPLPPVNPPLPPNTPRTTPPLVPEPRDPPEPR